jgi:CheY-like chemotaxis protein
MPVMDGFELRRILKTTREFDDIPIIILTVDHESVRHARLLDVAAAVDKADLEQIAAVVQQHCA